MATDTTRKGIAMTMSRDEFLAACHRPGAFQSVTWRSDTTSRDLPRALQRAGVTASKITSARVRTGIDYGNTAAVLAESREVGPLPWGEWAVEGYVITHKGRDYARLYIDPQTLHTAYFIDDRRVTRDEYLAACIPSVADREGPTAGCLTVKMDGILSMS